MEKLSAPPEELAGYLECWDTPVMDVAEARLPP
jgi:hypothetical protein